MNKNYIIGIWILVLFSIGVTATIQIGGYTSSGGSLFDNWVLFNSSAITGNTVTVYRDKNASNTNDAVMEVINDNAKDDKDALQVKNEGTRMGLRVDGSSNMVDGYCSIYSQTNTSTITGISCSNVHSVASNFFKRNLAAATTDGPVVYIENLATDDNQPALEVNNDANAPAFRIRGQSDINDCAAATGGGMFFNATSGHFYGCNGTDWVQLDN